MIYLLQVSVCWIVFYLLYHFFMRKETFFAINRFYLLGAIAMGLVIPHLATLIPENGASDVLITYNPTLYYVPDITVESTGQKSGWSIWMMIYMAGVVWMSFRFLVGLRQIYKYYRDGDKEHHEDITLIYNDKRHLPFSFFNYVFLSRKLPLKEKIDQIIKHEIVHASQLHSLDVIIVEILHIIFWFNPILILFKLALRDAHEYLADAYILEEAQKSTYSELLMSYASTGLEASLSHQFFHSQIKKRIDMIYKEKSTPKKLIRYLVVLPLFALVLLSFVGRAEQEGNDIRKEINEDLEKYGVNEATSIDDLMVDIKEEIKDEEGTIILDDLRVKYSDHADVLEEEFAKKTNNSLALSLDDQADASTAPVASMVMPQDTSREVFKIVEEMPRFPGCEDMTGTEVEKEKCAKKNMLEYIYQNIKYPKEALDAKVQGMAVVRFVVLEDGHISDVEVVRDPGAGTGAEAGRVVESFNTMSERWTPGKQRGKSVKVMYTLPIRFMLEDKEDAKVGDNFPPPPPPPPPPPLPFGYKIGEGQAILVVDGEIHNFDDYPLCHTYSLRSYKFMKREDAVAKFGDKGKYGAHIVEGLSFPKSDDVFRVVEQMPRFPGCEEMEGTAKEKEECAKRKMLEYVYGNLRYPEEAREQGIDGMSVIRFIVRTDGYLENIEIIRDPGAGTGAEAQRVIGNMNQLPQRWTPGMQKGEAVNVQYLLPVRYKLDNSKKKKGVTRIFVDGEEVKVDQFSLGKNPPKSIKVYDGKDAMKKFGVNKGDRVVAFVTSGESMSEAAERQLKVKSFYVYPNPSDGKVKIEAEHENAGSSTLRIFDINGQLVDQKDFDDQSIFHEYIFKEAGSYYLMLEKDGRSISTLVNITK